MSEERKFVSEPTREVTQIFELSDRELKTILNIRPLI